MPKFNRNKAYLWATVLLLNIGAALIFMRSSTICYAYLQKEYASLGGIFQLALAVPLYWFFGALVTPFVARFYLGPLAENPARLWRDGDSGHAYAVFYFVSIIGLSLSLAYSWANGSKRISIGLVITLSLLLNFLFLQVFFLSMSV